MKSVGRFKIPCLKRRAGSSPAPGTSFINSIGKRIEGFVLLCVCVGSGVFNKILDPNMTPFLVLPHGTSKGFYHAD